MISKSWPISVTHRFRTGRLAGFHQRLGSLCLGSLFFLRAVRRQGFLARRLSLLLGSFPLLAFPDRSLLSLVLDCLLSRQFRLPLALSLLLRLVCLQASSRLPEIVLHLRPGLADALAYRLQIHFIYGCGRAGLCFCGVGAYRQQADQHGGSNSQCAMGTHGYSFRLDIMPGRCSVPAFPVSRRHETAPRVEKECAPAAKTALRSRMQSL